MFSWATYCCQSALEEVSRRSSSDCWAYKDNSGFLSRNTWQGNLRLGILQDQLVSGGLLVHEISYAYDSAQTPFRAGPATPTCVLVD